MSDEIKVISGAQEAQAESIPGDPFRVFEEQLEADPRPWTATRDSVNTIDPFYTIRDAKRRSVINVCAARNTKENAELIVQAVNAHDKLVYLLGRVEDFFKARAMGKRTDEELIQVAIAAKRARAEVDSNGNGGA